jgi:hypothetical protein
MSKLNNIAATELVTLHYALKEIENSLASLARELNEVISNNAEISHLAEAIHELSVLELYFRKLRIWNERRRIKHGYYARNWTEFLLNHWENTLLDDEGSEFAITMENIKQILGKMHESKDIPNIIDFQTIAELIKFSRVLSYGLVEFEKSILDFIVEHHLDRLYAITEICNEGPGSGDHYRVGIPLYRHQNGDVLDLACPICFSRVRIRIGKHEFEGHVHGTSGDDVSKVVRELFRLT